MISLWPGMPRGDARTWRTVLPRIAAAALNITFLSLTEVDGSVKSIALSLLDRFPWLTDLLIVPTPTPRRLTPHPPAPPHLALWTRIGCHSFPEEYQGHREFEAD
jgi:hypothetical protein